MKTFKERYKVNTRNRGQNLLNVIKMPRVVRNETCL